MIDDPARRRDDLALASALAAALASALAAALASALACSVPEYEAVDGEHLRFEHDAADRPCAGAVRSLDALVPFFADAYHRPTPPPLRYTWIAASEGPSLPFDVADPCAGEVGCSVGSHAFAEGPFDVHELAHVVYGGLSTPFFREGIAVALAPYHLNGDSLEILRGPRYPELPSDPRVWMGARADIDVDDRTAGAFVSFLLVRHGPDKFADLFDHLGALDSMVRVRAVFRGVYGVELDDEVERFLAGVPCPDEPFPLVPYECLGPEIPWGDGRWTLGTRLACDDDAVAGGLSAAGDLDLARRSVTLEVPADGAYELRLTGDPGVGARLGPCFGCPWDAEDVAVDDAQRSLTVSLRAGHHYLLLLGAARPVATVGVALEAAP
ncbi:MAG: hypothetical protein R3B09_30380 [Nannocystaceae bacterium]